MMKLMKLLFVAAVALTLCNEAQAADAEAGEATAEAATQAATTTEADIPETATTEEIYEEPGETHKETKETDEESEETDEETDTETDEETDTNTKETNEESEETDEETDTETDEEPDTKDTKEGKSDKPKKPKKPKKSKKCTKKDRDRGACADAEPDTEETNEESEEKDTKEGKPNKPKKCTKKDRDACADAPACVEGARPKKQKCCLSCKPVQPPKCTAELINACKDSLENLPACTKDDKKGHHFDKEKCCPKCIKGKKDKKNKCSKEDRKLCSAEIAVCADGERPLKIKGQCCLSCKRPESGRSIQEVAECAFIADCDAEEEPVATEDADGELGACKSCRRPKPQCQGCAAMCVRTKDTDKQPVCKKKKSLNYVFKAAKDALKDWVVDATAEEIQFALSEIVERHCANPDNAAVCEFKVQLLDGITVRILERLATNDATEVEVDFPGESSERRLRRLLAASELLEESVADAEATGDSIAVTASGTPEPTTGGSDMATGGSDMPTGGSTGGSTNGTDMPSDMPTTAPDNEASSSRGLVSSVILVVALQLLAVISF